MSKTAYDGVFLAPESIVICPDVRAFVLDEDDTPAEAEDDGMNAFNKAAPAEPYRGHNSKSWWA